MSDPLAHTEDSLPSLVRRRVLAQLDLSFINLSDAENAAVDGICELVELVDQPMPLDSISDSDRQAAIMLMRQLPVTHPITRFQPRRALRE